MLTSEPLNPIDAPGTGEPAWRAWPRLRALRAADLSGIASAVVVAAHPDDEVLGAGGLISVLAETGARVRVIAVTDGEASHGGARAAGLAARRAAERVAALRALAAEATEVVRLRLPDTGLAGQEGRLAERLAGLTAGFDVCLAPWSRDVHADHEAAGRAAAAGATVPLLYFPVWMWHWAAPGDGRVPWDRARRVMLPPPVPARKRAAIRCFASQLEPRGKATGPVLSEEFVAHFTRDFEILFPAVNA